MRVRILRGAHEIGGNCVEIEADGSRIVLDVGRPLMAADDEYVALPDVAGFHEPDTSLLGVVISHAHQDHWGLVEQLPTGTPLYAGEATARILKEAAFFTKGVDLAPTGFLEHEKTFSLGPFTITPYLNDHSAFDAYSLLIEAGGKRLFYSADFRADGAKAPLFKKMLRNPPADIDVLLLEGTSIPTEGDPKPHSGTERQLASRVAHIISETKGMVLVAYSAQNIDRLVQLFRASKACNREFVMDLYTATIAVVTGNENIPRPGPE